MMPSRGTDFARKACALAATDNMREAIGFLSHHWGPTSTAAMELKASVSGAESTDNSGAMSINGESGPEFLELVHSLCIIGRLQNLRRVPSGIPVCIEGRAAVAYWVEQSRAVPMSNVAFTRQSLYSLKSAALTVFSNELVRSGSERAVAVVRDDLVEAAVRLSDLAFIDPSQCGLGRRVTRIGHERADDYRHARATWLMTLKLHSRSSRAI